MKHIKHITSPWILVGLLVSNIVCALLLPPTIYLFVFWMLLVVIILMAVALMRAAIFLSTLFDFIIVEMSHIEECKVRRIDEYAICYLFLKDPLLTFTEKFQKDYKSFHEKRVKS